MEQRSDIRPEQKMEDAYRIDLMATLFFLITMMAIFFLGRNVSGYYTPDSGPQVIDVIGAL